MDFDPNFLDKFPYLPGFLPENSSMESEIPIMVPLQHTSTLVPPPTINNFMCNPNNFHHFQHPHSLNGDNYHPSFEKGCPSSTINPISTIPIFSSSDPYNNGFQRDLVNPNYTMAFARNNNKVEVDYLNNGKDIWEVISTTGPPLLQDEFSYIAESERNHRGASRESIVFGDNDQNIKVQKKSTKVTPETTNLIKGHWTSDEDKVLVRLVERFGAKNWSQIAKILKSRDGKQCRDRWKNHLEPNIKKDPWTNEEEKILIEAHKEVGNKWTKIARRLPGRAENTIKNHWNATKRLRDAKKQNKKCFDSKERLLQKYIRKVTIVEKESKKSMSEMNLRNEDCNDQDLHPIPYESSEGDINTEDCGTQVSGPENDEVDNFHANVPHINRNDCYVPLMVNDDEMASGSNMDDSKKKYKGAMEMDSLMSETQFRKEMDLIEMFYRNL